MKDQSAITLLKEGNLDGLKWLVLNYQIKAIRTANLILRDQDSAEDVVQEAFTQLPRKIHSFDTKRGFEPWFLKIIVNDSLKKSNRQRKIISLDTFSESQFGEGTSQTTSSEMLIIALENTEEINKTLDRLTPKKRAVIIMRYYLEMSEKEITQQLNQPLSTIKWWLRSARKQLKDRLPESSKFWKFD